MQLKAILDIDPQDPKIRKLNDLCFRFGMFDMTETYLVAVESASLIRSDMVSNVSRENYEAVVKMFLACAVICFASWKHEVYEIRIYRMSDHSSPIIPIHRRFTQEELLSQGETNLQKAQGLINEFEMSLDPHTPAI